MLPQENYKKKELDVHAGNRNSELEKGMEN